MMTTTKTSTVLAALQSIFAAVADLAPVMHESYFTVGDLLVTVQVGKYSWHDRALKVSVPDWDLRKMYKSRQYTKFDDANLQKIIATIRELVVAVADAKARKTAKYNDDAARHQRINAVKQPLRDTLERAGLYAHQLQNTYEVRHPNSDTVTYQHTMNLSSLTLPQLVTVLTSLLPQTELARIGEVTVSGLSTAQVETLIASVVEVKKV